MTFATQMRTLRLLRGMSQGDLEKITGIPVNMISTIETGKVAPVPGSDWENRIKTALGWPADDSVFALIAAPQASPSESQL